MPHVQIKTSEIKKESELDPNTLPSTTAVIVLSRPSVKPVGLETFDSLFPHVDEIVALVTGPDPASSSLLTELEASVAHLPHPPSIVAADLSSPNYPHLYLDDVPETYTRGAPLVDEQTSFPTSGLPLVSCWCRVMELGLSLSSSEWCVFLREGEHLEDPEYLRGVCSIMRDDGRLFALTHSSTFGRARQQTKIVKNRAGARWTGHAVCNVSGSPTLVVGSLRSHRKLFHQLDVLKIHYSRIREGAELEALELAELASASELHECLDLAAAAADTSLARAQDPEVRSWASALKGLLYEHQDRYDRASDWYERSMREFPQNWKSALKLCRSRFMQKEWRACIHAYEQAVELHKDNLLLHDDGPEHPDRSLIHVASAFDKLGMRSDARAACRHLTTVFPNHPAVAELARSVG